jgi:hypothetical protein
MIVPPKVIDEDAGFDMIEVIETISYGSMMADDMS